MEKVTILIFLIAQPLELYGFPMATSRNFEENGNFEGDMKLEEGQLKSSTMMKIGLTNDRYRWPRSENGTVIVYYSIRDGSPYSKEKFKVKSLNQKSLWLFYLQASIDIQRIQSAMNEIQNKTCIRFAKRKNETDFVEIFSGNGCFSSVGRVKGRQTLSLMQYGCLRHGIIVHEFLHALGFLHMQSSYERDKYVRINYQNIESGRENNFQKYSNTIVSSFKTPYDLDSVLHYTRNAFSKNGLNTIETRNPRDLNRIGQRTQMSPGDVRRVRNMYCSI
jgi:Astacin (Peptidase family M12A)